MKKFVLMILITSMSPAFSSNWNIFSNLSIPWFGKEKEQSIVTLESVDVDSWILKSKENIKKKVLPNGLSILVFPKKDTPEVFMEILYKVGSANEGPGEEGFAHLVEHMVFKGTSRYSESDIKWIADRFCAGKIGEGFNASTTFDNTRYQFNSDKNNWPVFLEILASWMNEARFDENHFASETKVVYNELKQRNGDSVAYFPMHIFPDTHPYHHPIIGYKESVLTTSVQAVKNFYKKHYTPNNAILAVAGNVDPDEFFKEAEKLFGKISKDSDVNDEINFTPHFKDFFSSRTTVYRNIALPIVSHFWLIPAGKRNMLSASTSCLMSIISQRVERKLKDQYQYVFDIGCGSQHFFKDGYAYISYEPKDSSALSYFDQYVTHATMIQRCDQAIEEEINSIIKDGVTLKELEMLQSFARKAFLQMLESCHAITNELIDSFVQNESETDIFNSSYVIEALKQDDLKHAAQYIKSMHRVSIEYLPLPENEKTNWLKHQQDIDAYDKTLLDLKERTSEVEEHSSLNGFPTPKPLDFSFDAPDEEFDLENGIHVILKKRRSVPFVTLVWGIRNASSLWNAYKLSGKGSIPSFFYSQLFNESENYSKKDIEEFFKYLGVGYSSGGFSCLKSDFEAVSERYAELLSTPTFPKQNFDEALSNSITQLIGAKDNAGYQLSRMCKMHMYKGLPWIKNDEELINEYKTYTREDLILFHKTFICGQNIVLSVVGDFEEKRIRRHLEKSFGKIKQGHISVKKIDVPKLEDPAPVQQVKSMPSELTYVNASRLTTTREDRDWVLLVLLNSVLKNKLWSIRERNGIFYGANGTLVSGGSADIPACASIDTVVTPNNVEKAKDAIIKALSDIATNGISDEELEIAKHNIFSDLAKDFVTNGSIASSLLNLAQDRLDWDYWNVRAAKYASATKEDVLAVAKKYLDPATWSFFIVGRQI